MVRIDNLSLHGGRVLLLVATSMKQVLQSASTSVFTSRPNGAYVEGARQNLEIEATLDSISSHTTQAVIAPLARTDQLGPSLRVVRTPSGAPRASRTAPHRAEACGSGRAGLAAVVRVHAPWT